jgi:hypothetical protein
MVRLCWRHCASRHDGHEHSGIVIPVCGQIPIEGSLIGTIGIKVDPPEAAKIPSAARR